MAMLNCASDPSQEKITNYFDLVEKIDLLSKSNDDLMKAFNEANEDQREFLERMSVLILDHFKTRF